MGFLETKNIDVEEKHNLKSGSNKDKEKGFETKTRQETRTREKLMKKNVAIEYFDGVPFMKQKQRRKTRKEKDKSKEPKESKQERQEGRKTDKNKRETEKEKLKKGEAKKGEQ